MTTDTIVAIATPPGEGALGVVRLSGEGALAVAQAIFRPSSGAGPQKNFTVRHGHVVERLPDGRHKIVDEALLLLMRAPRSYTGEDSVEISAHGGTAVLQAVVKLALGAGARPAEPGEFTKRAFLNGRLDLLQAEAVLELIRARTERERDWASSRLDGALSRKMKQWKEELVGVLSHLEASVDFPDDFPEVDSAERIQQRIGALSRALQEVLRDSELAFIAKRGFQIALCGRPNVGKSSLLNRLVRAERAIVTPYPGTTRDVVEEESSLGGFAVRFQDTAGVRETEHPIEKEGVERSKKAAQGADLVLLVLDSSEALGEADRVFFEGFSGKKALVVLNKNDLPQRLDRAFLAGMLPQRWPQVRSSCIEPGGLEELEKAILAFILNGRLEPPQEALVGTARQKDLLEKVSKDLESATEASRQGLSAELVAGDVRQAVDRLGELVGEVFTDDILDVIFQQFCIGK